MFLQIAQQLHSKLDGRVSNGYVLPHSPEGIAGTLLIRTMVRCLRRSAQATHRQQINDAIQQLLCRGSPCHFTHLRPLGMSIDRNEIHLSLYWSGKIHMHPLPRLGRPDPWVKRCCSQGLFSSLTSQTTCCHFLQVLIQPWPPHMASRKGLHS